MLIFCLTLLVLLPSCSDQNIPEDFSQEESAFRDETSDTMESQAPLNQQEIRFDPERVLPGNPENYHVGAFDGDSIIYYVVEGTHFDVYSYDTKTGQTGKIGSIDNYTTYSRPMRFVALNGKYYFSIGRGDTYEDSVYHGRKLVNVLRQPVFIHEVGNPETIHGANCAKENNL